MVRFNSFICFLGVIIDDKLKFKMHINSTSQKLAKNAGVLYKLSEYVPYNTLLCLYRSFVESYLNYCILVLVMLIQRISIH